MKFKSTILMLFLAAGCFAQVKIGGGDDDMIKLKATTTLYFYPDEDAGALDEIKKAFDDSWTITKYELHPMQDFDKYKDSKEYSFLNVGSSSTSGISGAGYFNPTNSYNYTNTASDFYLWKNDGKDTKDYLMIGLHIIPDKESTSVSYDNLSPGYLRCYLKITNDMLLTHKVYMSGHVDLTESEIELLAKDTLYIPDYCFTNRLSGKPLDKQKIMDGYHHPYKIMTKSQMNELLLNSTKPVSFLLYNVSSTPQKFIFIVNTQRGIIFSGTGSVSGSLTDADISKINNQMK